MDRTLRKQQAKQAIRRLVGEPYVGKRLKMRRIEWELRLLRLAPREILDAGSEDATFTYWLADRFPEAVVTAVDIDEAAIADCRRARPARYAERVRFRVASFPELPDATYDLITAFDVLEHIPDDLGATRDLARALKPGGTLLVHVPRDRWTTRAGVVYQYPDEDAWQVNPGHVRQGYDPANLKNLLERAGLTVEDVQTWLGRWGVLAHSVYYRLEKPSALRLLSIPVTDACAALDRRSGTAEGNTVYARALRRDGALPSR